MKKEKGAQMSPNFRSRLGYSSSSTSSNRVRNSGSMSNDDDETDRGHGKRSYMRGRRNHRNLKYLSMLCFNLVRWIAQRRRRMVGSVLFILCLDNLVNYKRRYRQHFGVHPIHGGWIGGLWDRVVLQRVIDQTAHRRSEELAKIGVVLPAPHRTHPRNVLQINTNAALREVLVRRETRSRRLIEMEDFAETYSRGCGAAFVGSRIPKHILIPNSPSWPRRLRPGKPASFEKVSFDGAEMRHLIEDYYPKLLLIYDSLTNSEDRTRVWAICALHFFGGVFLGREATARPTLAIELLEGSTGEAFLNDGGCESPQGFALIHQTNTTGVDLFMMGVTPRSPHLRCMLNALEHVRGDADASLILSALFMETSWESSQTIKQAYGKDAPSSWERLSSKCYYGNDQDAQSECCRSLKLDSLSGDMLESSASSKQSKGSRIYVHGVDLISMDKDKRTSQSLIPATVDVREREGTEAPLKGRKKSLETLMKEEHSSPGWLCCRCLKTPVYGSLEMCSSLCDSGFERILCYAPDVPRRKEVTVEVSIGMRELKEGERRIPRIIHQTWFEELSLDRYPKLVRLQESWKSSGWDYRFYTDEQAREFIVNNFPARFVDAFDSLIPGAYKADLFRYLVLLKEGGIYADVDIMLDATLDTFVEPSLSFFAPRDVVGEYADEPFCLWNGVIGAAPGHPFIIRTVERVVGLILQRADLYDMEQDICRRQGRSMENWKVRAEPLLLASGPCALGVAVNEVLQRSSVAKFEIGWIPADHIKSSEGDTSDHGDALIMVGDKYDQGSFRISDAERNVLLASTDLPGVTKDPREVANPTRSELLRKGHRRPQGMHYSEAARGEYVWGAHNVYHDDYVHNENLTFHVVYN